MENHCCVVFVRNFSVKYTISDCRNKIFLCLCNVYLKSHNISCIRRFTWDICGGQCKPVMGKSKLWLFKSRFKLLQVDLKHRDQISDLILKNVIWFEFVQISNHLLLSPFPMLATFTFILSSVKLTWEQQAVQLHSAHTIFDSRRDRLRTEKVSKLLAAGALLCSKDAQWFSDRWRYRVYQSTSWCDWWFLYCSVHWDSSTYQRYW